MWYREAWRRLQGPSIFQITPTWCYTIMPGGLGWQTYFHGNTKIYFLFFSVLAFALMVQKQLGGKTVGTLARSSQWQWCRTVIVVFTTLTCSFFKKCQFHLRLSLMNQQTLPIVLNLDPRVHVVLIFCAVEVGHSLKAFLLRTEDQWWSWEKNTWVIEWEARRTSCIPPPPQTEHHFSCNNGK